jgi:general secretion pathway protein A
MGKRSSFGIVRRAACHAQGNYRALMNIAGELLALAAQREARQIDEKLFLETCTTTPSPDPKTATGRRR